VGPPAPFYGPFLSGNINTPGHTGTARRRPAAAPDYAHRHILTAAGAADPWIFQDLPVRIIFSRFFMQKFIFFMRERFSQSWIPENNFQKS
jgi:hypothetical protein